MAKYYNGVLLPDLPEGVLSEWPYVWIRKNGTTGYYDLVFSKLQPWYYDDQSSIRYGESAGECTYYQVPIASSNDATAWTFNSTLTTTFVLDANRTVLWSNTDIPYKSATAEWRYIHGSEPVDENAYVGQPDEKLYYNGVLLPAIPQGVLGAYPYAWIVRNETTRHYGLLCFSNGGYYDGTTIWDKGKVPAQRYTVAIDADTDVWTYADAIYPGCVVDGSKTTFLWSNHDMPNGDISATDVYCYASEPIPESSTKLVGLDYEAYSGFFVFLNAIAYGTSDPVVNYAVPVEKDCIYRVTMTEVGNRLRAAFTTTDPSTINAEVAANTVMYNPTTFSAGFTFANPAPADGWLVVYVSNAGETPDISISKVVPGEPEEPETPALVIGPDIRITEGMTIRGGVLHRIVLS